MPNRPQPPHIKERSIMAVILVLVLLLSPMTELWAALDAPWYSPYIVWSLAIFIAWWLQRYMRQNSDRP
jgi:hypothetical protein